MALSGSFSKSFHSGHYRYEIDWSATPNTANNTSTITAKTYIDTDSGWDLHFSATKSGSTTIEGQSSNWSFSNGINTNGGTRHLISTTTKTVTHASDGSLSADIASTFNIAVTIQGSTYYSSVSCSGVATLDVIQQARAAVFNGSKWVDAKGVWVYNNGWKKAKGIWVFNGSSWKPAK